MIDMFLHNPELDPTVFDALLEPVHAYVEQQNQSRTIHHNETYSYAEFFRLLAFFFVSSIPSIDLLLHTHLKKRLLPAALRLRYVPRSTFNDAFERFSPALFREVFIFLLSTLSLCAIPELATLGIFYCIDGSLFPTLCSMQWAEYRSTCQALKLHLCFELNRMIPVDCLVGTGKSSEREALRQMLVACVTYIADRGYVCFRLFHDIIEAQAHFIIRMRANLQYTIQTRRPVDLPASVRLLFREITDQVITCPNDPHAHAHRLVTFWAGSSHFLLLTDRLDLTTFQVIVLYAYRWQVELLFRFLKRTMHGIHLINHSEEGVTIQFYMLLIVALLQLRLKQQVMRRHETPPPSDSDEGTPPVQTRTDEAQSSAPQASVPSAELTEASTSPQPALHQLAAEQGHAQPYRFLAMIGEKLTTYWKIGIHWLTTLRQILHYPFNESALELLDSG